MKISENNRGYVNLGLCLKKVENDRWMKIRCRIRECVKIREYMRIGENT